MITMIEHERGEGDEWKARFTMSSDGQVAEIAGWADIPPGYAWYRNGQRVTFPVTVRRGDVLSLEKEKP